MILRLLKEIWRKRLQKKYRIGAELSQFLAPDIRRDVKIVDASEIDDGFVTAEVRTWNVLYAIRSIKPEPKFSSPKRIEIAKLWEWKGELWGGPVPDEDFGKGSLPPTDSE